MVYYMSRYLYAKIILERAVALKAGAIPKIKFKFLEQCENEISIAKMEFDKGLLNKSCVIINKKKVKLQSLLIKNFPNK